MKLQLKRSNVLELGAAKEPTAAQMEYGELAVNYNNGDPAIFLKDSNDNIIRIAGTGNINSGDNPSGDTLPPTGNQIGDMFFNTTNNTMYYWDGSAWVPIANDVTAADIFVGTLAEIDAEVPAADRRNGFLWWNVEDGTLYIWYIDANTSQFVVAIPSTGGGSGGGANVAVLNTPPTSPDQGDMWWNTVDGRLYIWYQDADSGQWVDASPDSQTSPITSGEDFPTDAIENDCFFNTTDGRLYIYYNDGNSLQWVDASPDSQASQYWDRISTTLSPSEADDDVEIGSGNITLNADGTASFVDDVDGKKFLATRSSAIDPDSARAFSATYAGTEVFGVDYNGAVKIGGQAAPKIQLNSNGTAGFNGSNGGGRTVGIHAKNPSSGAALFMYNPDNQPTSDMMTIQCGSTAGDTATRYINFRRNDGTIVGYIGMNGASAVTFSPNASDYRLKENVAPLPDSIERLKALRPVRYNFIASPDEIFDGFIAHECVDIPKAVIGEKDAVDENGEIQPQGLDVTRIIPVLTDALQKALTRIEELEARLTAAGL